MFESKIIKFYEKRANDNYGRSLDEMQHYNYEQLENTHNYIQWMFPLNEKSRVNFSAPILKNKDIFYIKQSDTIKKNMLSSVLVITDFWGIGREYTENKYYIKNDRIKTWLTPMNHNFIRISRVLKSLILFNMKRDAELLFNCLEEIKNNSNHGIIGESFIRWENIIKNK